MSENAAAPSNQAQRDYWNAHAGRSWAQFQELLDQQIAPLGEAAVAALAPRIGENILDIGCGCGQTSLLLAARVGPAGRVIGVDISEPMLAVARRRPGLPAQLNFREADAQSDDLGSAAFDAAYSRFGVMFFSDPVAAFRNIRRALTPMGRFSFVCWRELSDNPWMLAPLQAAQTLLPSLPPSDPLAPGPFAFADAARVRRLLSDAGFDKVEIARFDAEIGGSSLEDTRRLVFRVGPLAAALREHPDCADVVTLAVRQRLADFLVADAVFMPASVWVVTAQN